MKPIIIAILAVILAAGAQTKDEAERMFKAAKNAELVDGNLKAAIEQYDTIVAKFSKTDRAVTANALVLMAECYTKLGDAEAVKIYERVVSEFADQAESAATARVRLAALRPPAVSRGVLSTRQVWTGPPISGTVSTDGRFVTFTHWPTGGDLAVRDLAAGTNRLLTKRGDYGYAVGSVISPENRQVAYLWLETSEAHKPNATPFHVRIVPLDGKSAPRTVHRSANYLFVRGWTPDSQSLLVTRALDDDTWQLAMISVRDGSVRQLKSLQWARIGASISPDGRYIAYDAPVGDGSARDIFVLAADGSQEAAVVQHTANDHSTVWSPDGSRILFVSNRTGTPSLWSVPVKDGKPVGGAELLKSGTGPIKPLGMTHSGTLYYSIRGRSRRNVYIAALGADGKVAKAPETATDTYINSNWGAALSPDGESLAYYSNRPETVLVIRNLKTGQERVVPTNLQIDRLYFTGPGWLPDGRSVLVTARENQWRGRFLYRVDLATGNAEEVGRDIGAGFKESPDGESVFYATTNSTRLVRFDLDTRRKTVLRAVPPPTEYITNPAISPDGKQLAYLQQSEDETSLAVIASTGGEPRVIFRDSPRWHGGERYNTLEWTPDQRHLLFVKEEEAGNSIWRVPVAGGEAEKVGVSMNARIKAPQMHPDGRSIVFTAVAADVAQIWALENFLPARVATK